MSDYTTILGDIYARTGAVHPKTTWAVVFILGGLAACVWWWSFAQRTFERQQAVLAQDVKTDTAVQRLDEAIAALQAREPVINVTATVAATPRKDVTATLLKLSEWLLNAEDLERAVVAQRGSPAVEKSAVDFYNKVVVWLATELGADYAARFRAAQSNQVPLNYPSAKVEVYQRLAGRKAFLAETIKELRAGNP